MLDLQRKWPALQRIIVETTGESGGRGEGGGGGLTHLSLASHKRDIGKQRLIRVYTICIKLRSFYKTS